MTQIERQAEHFIKTNTVLIMLLFSLLVVIFGLKTSVAFYSFTGSRDVLPSHPSDRTLLNGIKLVPFTRQLWNCTYSYGAAHKNDSASGSTYVYVCWEDNDLETCQKVTQEGKHCYIIDLL